MQLTEQKQQKLLTRSTARHLRRKRFRNARKAEKQLLETVNGMIASSSKEINTTEESDKTEKVQLKPLSVKTEDSYSLSRSAASLDLSTSKNKTEIQHIICKNTSEIEEASHFEQNIQSQDCCKGINTKVDQIKLETIDVGSESHSSYLSHSYKLINGSKHKTEDTVSQIANNEKEKHSKTSVPLDESLSNALYSVPNKGTYRISYNFDYSNFTYPII